MTLPPRFVPTLTEVVSLPETAAPPMAEPLPAVSSAVETAIDEELVLRVLQRVESDLQRRLGPLIERVVQKQATQLAQGLVHAVEPLVRQSVTDAVAAELQRDSVQSVALDPRVSP